MDSRPIVLCFGEVLWDSTPKGLFLGGAPTNVAYHLKQLGTRPLPVSAVGADYLGAEVLRRVSAWGVSTDYISVVPDRKTGVVQVDLSRPSDPTYDIVDHVAWDVITEKSGLIEEAKKSSALVFGSLALRHESNRILLEKLLSTTSGLKVFDVNLRPPYVDNHQVLALMKRADLVKLNLDELEVLHPFAVGSIEVMAATFSGLIGNVPICCTAGHLGAGYWDGHCWNWEDAMPLAVKGDAVGAGDSFLAAIITGLIDKRPIKETLINACRLAEFVASSDGAQPIYDFSRLPAHQ